MIIINTRRFKDKNKEATAIKRSLDSMSRKYGFELVKYVANRMFEKELAKRKLEDEIKEAEQKLSELKETKI